MSINADETILTVPANTTVEANEGLYSVKLRLIDSAGVLSDELIILLRVGSAVTDESDEEDDEEALVFDVGA